MKTYLTVFLVTLVILLLCLAGLAVKTLLHKGELKRHCAGRDPYSGESYGCVCAIRHQGSCAERQRHPYQPLDINDNLIEEL